MNIEIQNAYLRSFYRNLNKTLYYLDVFARFKDEENIKAVERLLNSHTELEMFERSQLGEFRS
jgi:DNA-directed RNA polymerase II subunit RPB4